MPHSHQSTFDGRHVSLGKDVREQANELVLLLRQTVFRVLPHDPAGHFVGGEEVVSDAADPVRRSSLPVIPAGGD